MASVVKCVVCGVHIPVPHGIDAEDCGMWRGCRESRLMCEEHKLAIPPGADADDDARCPICTGAVAKVRGVFAGILPHCCNKFSERLNESCYDTPASCCT
jgi:hypothetical protein